MHTDISNEHFLFKVAPPAWHPYISLMRLDRPIGTWLLLFPCWWGVVLAGNGLLNMNAQSWKACILFALGAVLMRGTGCTLNDIMDKDLDAQVERTKNRPLPSGAVTVQQAKIFLGVLLFLSALVLLQFSWKTIGLGVLSLALVAAYPRMKRLIPFPQLFLGFTFNWGVLMGWAQTTGTLTHEAFFLYAAGIFWTLGYDTVYAHQDKKDDIAAGIKSTALLFGGASKTFVSIFYALTVVLMIKAKYGFMPTLLTPFFCAVMSVHLFWQVKTWNPDDPASCLKIFKSNRIFGLLALIMLSF